MVEVVELLIKHGNSVVQRATNGKTPIDLVRFFFSREMKILR